MLRKIGVTLLCATGLFATNAFSTTEHLFTQGLAVEYELPPNDPQVFSNIFFWEVKAICIVISDVQDNTIRIKMLRKSGSVNGLNLTTDDVTSLTAHPGDKLHITAASGAKVELTNVGAQPIKASCSTG